MMTTWSLVHAEAGEWHAERDEVCQSSNIFIISARARMEKVKKCSKVLLNFLFWTKMGILT